MRKNSRIVFIIEDDDYLAKALETLLSYQNYQCFRYSSGEEFLEKLSNKKQTLNFQINSTIPNCCLLDIRLQQISGVSLFQKFSELPGNKLTPVIFLTGHGDLQMAVNALKKGAFDFITKPFKTEHLIETVKSGIIESELRIEQQNFITQSEKRLNKLTEREREIINPITSGLSNKEIAINFNKSIRTIELHRSRVLKKL